MSLEQHIAARGRRESAPIFEPTYTIDEFCAAERISRSMLYRAWQEGWGPRFYLNGICRRITHAARLEWQHARRRHTKRRRLPARVYAGLTLPRTDMGHENRQ
jgi:hypothetical protein